MNLLLYPEKSYGDEVRAADENCEPHYGDENALLVDTEEPEGAVDDVEYVEDGKDYRIEGGRNDGKESLLLSEVPVVTEERKGYEAENRTENVLEDEVVLDEVVSPPAPPRHRDEYEDDSEERQRHHAHRNESE